MFHWICPECGQEIAPGVKECPVCEPLESIAPVPEVASAPIVAEPPARPAKQSAAAPKPPAPIAKESVVEPPVPEPTAALQPEVILRPEVVLQPKAFQGLKPPVILSLGLDAIPAEARRVVMPDVPLGTSPVELPDPLLEPASDRPPHPETFADRLADLAELLHGERLPYAASDPRVDSAPKKAPQVLDVPFHGDVTLDETPARAMLAAPPSRLLLAEPQPPSVAPQIPIGAFDPRPAEHTVRSQEALEAEPAAASSVLLPDPPARTAAPALAPLEDYSPTADRLMRPAEFVTPIASAKALPKVTLPGPALPRELMSLQAAGLVPIRRGGKRGEASPSRSGWMLKSLVVGILLTAGVATYSMLPGAGTPASAPPRPAPQPAPDPPVSVRSTRSTNSLARNVEVTGIRFMEVNKKPQIHYLVVNHSSAPLSSVTVYVTLRATTAKPGQAPIARLTFRAPALAGFEAKEMFSSIERESAPLDLPDWQDLRADVDVQ